MARRRRWAGTRALAARLSACSTLSPIDSQHALAGLTGRITEDDVDVAMREVRLALLKDQRQLQGRQGLRQARQGARGRRRRHRERQRRPDD